MSLPTWARKETFAVWKLEQIKNFRGSNIDTWTDSGETLVCALQSADDAAIAIAGARGRTVTKIAFTDVPALYEPERVKLVGTKTWLVREVFDSYEDHAELGLEQVPDES